MNSYLGIDFLPSCPTAFACRVKRTWIWRFLGTYRCPVTSLRILARSNLKDSMSFLTAQPSLAPSNRSAAAPGRTTPRQARLPAIRVVNEGINPLCVHQGSPKAGSLGPAVAAAEVRSQLPPRERLREPAGVEEEHREEDDQQRSYTCRMSSFDPGSQAPPSPPEQIGGLPHHQVHVAEAGNSLSGSTRPDTSAQPRRCPRPPRPRPPSRGSRAGRWRPPRAAERSWRARAAA